MIVMRVCRCPSSFWLKTVVGQQTYLIKIYLHTIAMDNETLRAVWFYSRQHYGTWQPFYKEHNQQLEDAFGLSTTSLIELQPPHPDGVAKLFVSITEPLVSFIQRPNGHYVSLHTVMRALVPANFELMPVPEKGSEKKDTNTPETPCLDASKK